MENTTGLIQMAIWQLDGDILTEAGIILILME